ncbi:MAG: efflux RND transporter periplasmic adaptor subunit [Gemmatimonadota bacterium]|nr:MAG: efflux RND transporter periplasmic adaptor subunit [Gemmatimonadota bacterium]
MKRRTKVVLGVAAAAVVGVGAVAAVRNGGSNGNDVRTVEVERGEIVDKALAVGQIEPEVEISVKSKISGVVSHEFAEVGEFVRAGAPLLEIKPTPTPLELVETRRQLELRQLELDNQRRELARQRSLMEQGLISQDQYETAERAYDEAELNLKLAEERLALLEEGRVRMADQNIDAVIKSPIDGFILEKNVEIGDPVVPLNPYQEGTVLITMAEMTSLIFRGTVDEIDVGRLREGMPVEIKIGALPNAKVTGTLYKISLKARTEDNATVFPVEIALDPTDEVVLRAGYSAQADVIIDRRDDALMVPERLVRMSGDTARVTVLLDDGSQEERVIETGLSDAINVEVISGLEEGEKVVEPPPREIE